MDLKDKLHKMRDQHTGGYVPAGICLGCRHGWHSHHDGEHVDSPGCKGRRYRNSCPDYLDMTPTTKEYIQIYDRELRKMLEQRSKYDFLRTFGSASRRRQFLKEYAGAAEEELRRIEDNIQGLQEADEGRLLKKLRCEL